MADTDIQMLAQIATLAPILIAVAFYLGAFLYRTRRLTEKNSIITYGTLIGFKYYYSANCSTNYSDYMDNRRGSYPLIEFTIDGIDEETVYIPSMRRDNTMTKNDIGKQYKIRYRKFLGITMIIDKGDLIKRHNRMQTILFWIFMCIGTCCMSLGFIANACLPIVLRNI